MKTHPLNVSYLVVGLAFLGIAGSWALRESGVIDSVDWLLPLTLVVAGGIGLMAFVAKNLRRGRTDAPTTDTSYHEQLGYEEELGYDDPTTLIETDTQTQRNQGETR